MFMFMFMTSLGSVFGNRFGVIKALTLLCDRFQLNIKCDLLRVRALVCHLKTCFTLFTNYVPTSGELF